MSVEIKQKIAAALSEFQTNNLFDNGINLFRALGYNTERQQKLDKSNYKSFKESFVEGNNKLFNEKKALSQSWKQVHLLFQLTKAELLNQGILFDTKKVDNKIIEAYLFFAIELNNSEYTRTHLSEITREINKLFPMPVMVLFKLNERLTLSVINRRLHKKDENKDVLEKITLIKDIDIANPHRGHIEILFDLSFQELYNNHQFDSFVSLHSSWQKTLDANELNKKFYQELANWYFWATEKVEFPNDIKFNKDKDKDRQIRNSTNVIRLITRLIFTWFLKEKNLVPDELFDEKKLKQIINSEDKTGSTYYKAILQNLFFATLNTPMNADQSGSRKFIKDQHLVHTLYRYERFFINKKRALELFENIPFLNGGLFECLDKKTDSDNIVRLDCFSDNPKNEKRLVVPDELFFSDYQPLDLNTIYQTKNRKYKVRGLINILNAYKFTIHENTPIEEEVALDPELLGKVFENLLASYNPETETTARKQTGSFYTPREIVNYMVDESLLAYFTNYLEGKQKKIYNEEDEAKLKILLTYTEEPSGFTALENRLLVDAIFNIKILDPACGSGAFPMGVLHKLVYILRKIDKDNKYWRELQKQKAIKETEEAFNIGNQQERENRLKDISDTFENNNEDYGRKLYLIENSVYGVDIQPIAVQIAKLRFFISLIVDQKIDNNVENIGVRPLPNLETKFVAANTLIGIERPVQQSLRNPLIDVKEKELKQVREKHFTARTPKTKDKYRSLDATLRKEIAGLLNKDGFGSKTTEMLSNWNPYDQNTFADFFDTEWMFSFRQGFDIVIGNPPWGAKLTIDEKIYLTRKYPLVPSKIKDSYLYFLCRSLDLVSVNSGITLILPNTWLLVNNAKDFRKHFLNYKIREINDYGDGIFDKAVVESSTISLSKFIDRDHPVKVKKYKKLELISDSVVDKTFWREDDLCRILLEINDNDKKVVKKAYSRGVRFSDVCQIIWGIKPYQIGYGKPPQTESDVDNRIFHSKNCKNHLWKPLLVGGNINRFSVDYSTEEYIKYGPWLMYSSNEEIILSPKILLRQTSDILRAVVDQKKYYPQNSLFIIHSSKLNLYYLAAILNSNLLNYLYRLKNPQKGKIFAEVKPSVVKELPINLTSENGIKAISIISEFLHKNNNIESFSFFELLINSLVYELYFPDELKAAKCEILKHLTVINSIDVSWSWIKKNDILNQQYLILNSETHPLRKSMEFMDTVDEIAIIEGKKS